jgi:hypothetical protein
MKIKLEPIQTQALSRVRSLQNFDRLRQPTSQEKKEMNRILSLLTKFGSDENISNYFLKNDLTSREVLLLLSSECAEIIEFTFQLLVFQNGNLSVNEEDQFSLWLYCLTLCPQALPVFRETLHWHVQSDVSNILKNIRVRATYFRRPKRSQRKKGYTDKGSLPSQQEVFVRTLYSEEAQIEAVRIVERNKRLYDTAQFLIGASI